MVSSMLRVLLPAVVALGALASPSAAAQRGSGSAGQRCASCDSATARTNVVRSREAEIANKTVDLARSRILVEHIRSRLASGSSDAPKTAQEREELESMLVVRRQEMAQLERELSALCGDAHAGHGYLGIDVTIYSSGREGAGRTALTRSYPIVTRVEPGSPAARAGIAPYDTIVSINKRDVRARDLGPLIGQPGERVTIGLARAGVRREAVLTVAPRPATYGGACLQYRDVVFSTPSGETIVMRSPGARGSGGAMTGTLRSRANAVGAGGAGGSGERQQVRVQLMPDSLAQTTAFFVFPSGASGTALFLPRGATGAIVAGAEVALINGGLRTVFAVDHGALVVNVAPRSPAEQAGILSGDVIVRAQDEPVTAISVLQRQIRSAGERRNVKLDIIRAKQPMVITLRW